MGGHDNLSQFIVEKFDKFGKPMTNDVMEQLARQSSDPVSGITQNGCHVTSVAQIVGPIAFHMDRLPSQKSCFREPTHFQHLKSELIIMTSCHLQTAPFCKFDQRFRLFSCNGKRLLQINVAPEFKALFGELEMTWWRGCNVDHLRLSTAEHFLHISKAFGNVKALAQLFGHEQFLVADRDYLAIRNPMNRANVLIRYLSAPNYSYTKHRYLPLTSN